MSRNKNHRPQMSFDNPEVEGEFLEESADSMLTVSDSFGNMDTSDSVMMLEVDRSKLDDYPRRKAIRRKAPPRVQAPLPQVSPYLLALGGLLAGVALARIIPMMKR